MTPMPPQPSWPKPGCRSWRTPARHTAPPCGAATPALEPPQVVSTHDRKLLATGEGGFVLTNDLELAERIDFYTHLGHLQGQVHGVNYKLAGPLAAIGLRRLPRLHAQLEARRCHAQRILDRLPSNGLLHELDCPDDSQPNYYQLVLATTARQRRLGQRPTVLFFPPVSGGGEQNSSRVGDANSRGWTSGGAHHFR